MHQPAPKAIAALHEDVEHIDLPVFPETRPGFYDWTRAAAEDRVAQQ